MWHYGAGQGGTREHTPPCTILLGLAMLSKKKPAMGGLKRREGLATEELKEVRYSNSATETDDQGKTDVECSQRDPSH